MVQYKQGDLITISVPYVYALNDSERGLRCDCCLNSASCQSRQKLKRCSNCKLSFYCNSDCQKIAWNSFHKYECSQFRVFSLERCPTETFIFFARLAYKVLNNQKPPTTELVCNNSRTFADLESHVKEIKEDSTRKKQFLVLEHFLKSFHPRLQYDGNILLSIFGKMVVNTYTICDPEFKSIGTGLYLGASIFNHSCDPNATAVFNETSLYVRAIKQFKSESYQDILINYLDPVDSTIDRQKSLKDQYYFLCNCCSCLNTEIDNMKTKILNTEKYVELVTEVLKLVNSDPTGQKFLSSDEKQSLLKECKVKLKLSKEILGKGNVYRIRLLNFAFDLCIDLQLWEESLHFALPTLKYYRMYYSKYYPAVGILLFKVAKIQHLIGQLLQAESTFLEAKQLLIVCHGKDHKLVQELDSLLKQCQMEIHLNQQSRTEQFKSVTYA